MPGPRVFTSDEANALLPDVEEVLLRLDKAQERVRRTKIRINALELIHGPGVQEDENADHREYVSLVEQLAKETELFNTETQRIGEMGGVLKGVEPALVDFYGVHEGLLVFLCWRRGEPAITHWHHVDTGFSDRQPLDSTADWKDDS